MSCALLATDCCDHARYTIRSVKFSVFRNRDNFIPTVLVLLFGIKVQNLFRNDGTFFFFNKCNFTLRKTVNFHKAF